MEANLLPNMEKTGYSVTLEDPQQHGISQAKEK